MDRPAKDGKKKFKALFVYNDKNQDSIYDFFAFDGTHICTICVPSGHCLFASPYALGMLILRK
jgi:hypothetical protein